MESLPAELMAELDALALEDPEGCLQKVDNLLESCSRAPGRAQLFLVRSSALRHLHRDKEAAEALVCSWALDADAFDLANRLTRHFVDQRDITRALATSEKAMDLASSARDRHLARLEHCRALYADRLDFPRVQHFASEARQFLGSKDPYYLFACSLELLARAEGGLGTADELKILYQHFTDLLGKPKAESYDEARLAWLKAIVLRRLGDSSASLENFGLARRCFDRLGRHRHAAVVALEEASLELACGSLPRAYAAAGLAFPVLRLLSRNTEAHAAVMLCMRATSVGCLTSRLLANAIRAVARLA